jgi:hypothetical protein
VPDNSWMCNYCLRYLILTDFGLLLYCHTYGHSLNGDSIFLPLLVLFFPLTSILLFHSFKLLLALTIHLMLLGFGLILRFFHNDSGCDSCAIEGILDLGKVLYRSWLFGGHLRGWGVILLVFKSGK